MAHGVALTMRKIQPEYKMYRMTRNKAFVCTSETCRARRRNIHFKRLPQGMGNMSLKDRQIYATALKVAAEEAAKLRAEGSK